MAHRNYRLLNTVIVDPGGYLFDARSKASEDQRIGTSRQALFRAACQGKAASEDGSGSSLEAESEVNTARDHVRVEAGRLRAIGDGEMLNGKGDERARGDVPPRKPQRGGRVHQGGHGGTAERSSARAGSGSRGSRKPKGNRRGDVAAVDVGFRPEVVREVVGDAMALARDGGHASDRGDPQARPGLGQHGRQRLSEMTWNQITSWAGLTLAVALVIFAAVAPR